MHSIVFGKRKAKTSTKAKTRGKHKRKGKSMRTGKEEGKRKGKEKGKSKDKSKEGTSDTSNTKCTFCKGKDRPKSLRWPAEKKTMTHELCK